MLVEAARGVPWTKPEDLPFDPDPAKPLPKLGGHTSGGFHVVMWDGLVKFLQEDTSDSTLRGYITLNGGGILGDDF
jgi:hypothetical protein